MSKYIAMKSTHKGLFLEIELGSVCNYQCSYCPPQLHCGNIWLHANFLTDFIEFINPSHVLLVGGEPTYYPQINDLLEFLKEREDRVIDITSNGSKPLKWWKKYKDYIDIITLSYHLEFASLDKFNQVVEEISQDKIVTINVSMIVDRFDECLQAAKELTKHKNTFVCLKALNNIKTGKLYEYTQRQLQMMAQVHSPKIQTTHNKHSVDFYGLRKDMTLEKQIAQKVISNNENNYKGWKCWKGIQYLRINENGDVFKCARDLGRKPYGNIQHLDFIIPTEPVVCEYDQCFCLTNLKCINKEKI